MHGPGAVDGALSCTTDNFFKSTRLFKIRRIGFLQIRSRATYSRFYAHAGGTLQYKIKGGMEDYALSFELLVDMRPRRRHGVVSAGGRSGFYVCGPCARIASAPGVGVAGACVWRLLHHMCISGALTPPQRFR